MALWPYGRVPGLLLGVAMSLHITELCRASVGRASRSLGWILEFQEVRNISKPNQKLPGKRHILSI